MTTREKKPAIAAVVQAAIEEHGSSHDALIPILSEINNVFGHIPADAYAEVRRQVTNPASAMFVSEGHLYSLASFYHMLSTEPLGKHVVRFCESAPCHVMGGREVFQALQDALELKPNQTSPDEEWSLITTSCLGVCGIGPVFLVDEDMYGNVKPEQVPGILAQYQ